MIEMRPSSIKNEKMNRILEKTSKVDKNSLYLWFCESDWIDILNNSDKSQLTKLTLWNCEIKCYKMSIFMQNQWPNLKILNLAENKLGTKGIKFLTKCTMSQLQLLSLGDCQIENEGIRHLIKGNWKNLSELTIYKNYVSCAEMSKLQQISSNKIKCLYLHKYRSNDRDNDAIATMSLVLTPTCESQIQIIVRVSNHYLDEKIKNIYEHKFYEPNQGAP